MGKVRNNQSDPEQSSARLRDVIECVLKGTGAATASLETAYRLTY